MTRIMVPNGMESESCSMCGKEFRKDRVLSRDGDLCPECRKTYGDMAFVYCNTCGKVVSRLPAGAFSSGFMVMPGDLLHVKCCPVCSPGVTEVIPEEVKMYEKVR